MPGGRPSKYNVEFVKQAYKLALLGAKNPELADFFEVNTDTIKEWRKIHPEFSAALKKGKELADMRVSKNLYKRANGFYYDEVTHEEIEIKQPGAEVGKKIIVPATLKKVVRKMVVPDTTAQIFWLKNRQPDKWRDKNELSLTVPEEQVFTIAGQKIKFG